MTRCMCSNNNLKRNSILGFSAGGQPLKSQGWPFHLMDNQSIIQITTIFHPNLMFLFWREFRLLIHWREYVIKLDYYYSS